jgi:hypothetical protein
MVLSKRERYIGLTTVALVGIVGVHWLIVDPLIRRAGDLKVLIAEARDTRERHDKDIQTSERAARLWSEMSGRNLPRDASDADQMINYLSDWAQDVGLSLSSVKPERSEREKDFHKKTYRATGSGGMGQIGRFLHRIQTASVPVRIADLTLSSRKEGTDDLSLSVGVATIYPATENERSRSAGPLAMGREARP